MPVIVKKSLNAFFDSNLKKKHFRCATIF